MCKARVARVVAEVERLPRRRGVRPGVTRGSRWPRGSRLGGHGCHLTA